MWDVLELGRAPEGTRVVVAMSGGVDSSVTAGLLARAGYDVVGVTLQLYDHGASLGRKGACCAGQDIADARRVAESLGIPHYVLDYEERFRRGVIESFADSYARGETPVPCVACNQTVKFSDLLDMARSLGAAALATGHYVESRAVGNGRGLFRPADAARDQSYFLFATTREQLDFLRFPLGGMAKADVRSLARELALPVADKDDSQDICFVPNGRYSDVVARLKPNAVKAGDVVHVDGRVLGRHSGIINFTIGQRRGLGLSKGEALYVVAIRADTGEIIVGRRDGLRTTRVDLRDLNWIGSEEALAAGEPIDVYARVRSTRQPKPGRLVPAADGWAVELVDGEEGVAPGQACVLYDSDQPRARVLGGGFIERIPVPGPMAANERQPLSAH